MRRALGVALPLALLLCALGTAIAHADSPPPRHDLRLFFDAREPWSRPMVELFVFGRRLNVLVDTGSSLHAIAPRVTPLGKDALAAADAIGWDFMGMPIMGISTASAAARLPGFGTLPGTVYVSEWADDLSSCGPFIIPGGPHLDGLIAPARLAREGQVVVLDLAGTKMWIGSKVAAERRLAQADLALTRGPVTLTDDWKAIVPVVVAGHIVRMVIDTGAPASLLYLPRGNDVPPGAVRSSQRTMEIRAGQVETSADLRLVEALGDRDYDGLLGMDALRSCILVFDQHELTGRCLSREGERPTQRRDRPEPPAATFEDLSALRSPLRRRQIVQFAQKGPAMRMRADGGFDWEGRDVVARIHPDGTITYRKRAHRSDGAIRMRTDDRDERQWFFDETLSLRDDLARGRSRELIQEALTELPSRLARVLHDGRLTLAERRHLLFLLWDEACEPDDRELGWAGARARRLIESFVRNRLPAGSGVGYSEAELAVWNRARPRGPRFDPYHPPSHEEYGEDVAEP
jgi:hypothetical protein